MSCTSVVNVSGIASSKHLRRQRVVCSAQHKPQFTAMNKFKSWTAAGLIAAGLAAGPALADGVEFSVPTNNATVAAPVHVEMKVFGMEVLPAADGLIEGTGHFHVMVDETEQYEEGRAIPFDSTHLHYGKGQTAADITLPPGKHSLTLQFANAVHQSYGPTFAKTIYVNVGN